MQKLILDLNQIYFHIGMRPEIDPKNIQIHEPFFIGQRLHESYPICATWDPKIRTGSPKSCDLTTSSAYVLIVRHLLPFIRRSKYSKTKQDSEEEKHLNPGTALQPTHTGHTSQAHAARGIYITYAAVTQLSSLILYISHSFPSHCKPLLHARSQNLRGPVHL